MPKKPDHIHEEDDEYICFKKSYVKQQKKEDWMAAGLAVLVGLLFGLF